MHGQTYFQKLVDASPTAANCHILFPKNTIHRRCSLIARAEMIALRRLSGSVLKEILDEAAPTPPKTRVHGYGRALYLALKDEVCRGVSLIKNTPVKSDWHLPLVELAPISR